MYSWFYNRGVVGKERRRMNERDDSSHDREWPASVSTSQLSFPSLFSLKFFYLYYFTDIYILHRRRSWPGFRPQSSVLRVGQSDSDEGIRAHHRNRSG